MSLDDGRMPEHYIAPVASSTSRTLTKATQEAATLEKRTNQYTCCPSTVCLYTDPNGQECLELINCGTTPNHFKNRHGITNMGREVKLVKLPDTTIFVTSESVTSDTIAWLLTHNKPSYGWKDELFKSHGGFGSMIAMKFEGAGLGRLYGII
ncbi:hypothetical protein EDC04DRAFT_2597870 [Pisolithus marmoratus]|nr:hypothetical protein EDC04DRAFT_2597870 [Pisolithus marmoratus]